MSAPQSAGDSRQLAGLAHILGIITGFLAPLIIWLMKKGTDAKVEEHAKEALNFQITMMLLYIANSILSVVLFFIWWMFAWVIYLAIFVITVWWAILAYQAAAKGDSYKYPFALRLIK